MAKAARRAGRKRKQRNISLAGDVVVVNLENPHFQRGHSESQTNPKKVPVQFDMRENYAGYLWARGHIDEDQKEAATRIRAAYERMGGSGAQAIDYGKERVDGGQIAQTITDAHLVAARTLREAFTCLGPEGYYLVISFCGEGQWPKEFNRTHAIPKAGILFRECLTALAELWGYKTRSIRVYRVA